MRLRSDSMARARKWRKRKMFSSAGPMWWAIPSSHAKSCFWKGLQPFSRKMRPLVSPPCSNATVKREPTFSSC